MYKRSLALALALFTVCDVDRLRSLPSSCLLPFAIFHYILDFFFVSTFYTPFPSEHAPSNGCLFAYSLFKIFQIGNLLAKTVRPHLLPKQ